jgi:hypothetical protein
MSDIVQRATLAAQRYLLAHPVGPEICLAYSGHFLSDLMRAVLAEIREPPEGFDGVEERCYAEGYHVDQDFLRFVWRAMIEAEVSKFLRHGAEK